MTPQLLILGNGFDVHCGLKSSYKDFFREAILDVMEEPSGLIQLQKGVTGFWENLLLEYYKVNKNVNYNWCDVETIIKDTLCRVFFGYSKYIEDGLWRKALDSANSQKDWNILLNETDSIGKYLLKYCSRYYKKHIILKKYSNEETVHLLVNQLFKELHSFERRFCKYIKENIVDSQNQKDINTIYIINALNLLNKLTGFYDGTFENIDSHIHQTIKKFVVDVTPNRKTELWRRVNVLSDEFSKLKYTHILSFNYTALFDILSVESPCIYSNVHGKLCSEHCEENCAFSNIIFGIDDNFIQSKNEYSELRLFSKTYRKMFNTGAPTSILPSNNVTPLIIKFYGHSLSEADYSYFQSIFDYYNLYGNSNVSLIFYYSKGFEQTDSVYRLINSYGRTLSNQEQGKNLMHKLLLENRLKIIEITD